MTGLAGGYCSEDGWKVNSKSPAGMTTRKTTATAKTTITAPATAKATERVFDGPVWVV
jgi:hypothetical protein